MATLRMLGMMYRRNVRVQPLRELLAVVGVAAGVAMLFAVQISNGSITEAFERTAHGVAGRARIEVAARGTSGFDESLIYPEVTHTPGVVRAAPLLQQEVALNGPAGSRSATLVGADERLFRLGGKLVAAFWRTGSSDKHGVLLVSENVARALGARTGQLVGVELNGVALRLFLSRPVPSSELGSSAGTVVAALPLAVLQELAGLHGRATRILVQAAAGRAGPVEGALRARLGATVNVRSTAAEPAMLAEAARTEREMAALFGVISLIVGGVLAFNALLLASGERRALVDHLSRLGAPDRLIVASLVFDALLIGVAGCAIGLVAGDLLSTVAYHSVPGYLGAAFPLSEERVIAPSAVAIAVGAGMLAALAAAAFPAVRVLRSSGVLAAPRGAGDAARSRHLRIAMLAAGLLVAAVSSAVALAVPGATVGGIVGLLTGLMLCTPAGVALLLRGARALSRRVSDPAACLAAAELQTDPTRSLAVAVTGMIALFVIVTIGGAVGNIERAVSRGAGGVFANASLWINPDAASNVYSTQSFRSSELQQTLERLPQVRRVLPYRESFLDWNGRRVWAIGVPPAAAAPVVASQLIDGAAANADARLRTRGWAVMSQSLASREHVRVGSSFSLPTPSGIVRLRLAATVSNYGWLEGTVLLSEADYRAYWQTSRASALGVVLEPGVSVARAEPLIRGALPRDAALSVETDAERQRLISSVLASTLSRLRGIATAVLLAALASVIAMMIAAVWARRARIDGLIAMGTSAGQLVRLVCYETGTVMVGGCLVGLASGFFGQALIVRWVHSTTGSPVQFSAAWVSGVQTLLVACAIVALAAAMTVLRTLRLPPRAAFSTE